MSQTTMGGDLLQSLQVFTQLAVKPVGHHLSGRALMHVLPAVEDPAGDAIAFRVLDDSDDLLDLCFRQLACPLVQVDTCSLQHEAREPQTAALDSPKRKGTLASSVDVGVEDTQDELEVFGLCDDQRALRRSYHRPQEINMAIRSCSLSLVGSHRLSPKRTSRPSSRSSDFSALTRPHSVGRRYI